MGQGTYKGCVSVVPASFAFICLVFVGPCSGKRNGEDRYIDFLPLPGHIHNRHAEFYWISQTLVFCGNFKLASWEWTTLREMISKWLACTLRDSWIIFDRQPLVSHLQQLCSFFWNLLLHFIAGDPTGHHVIIVDDLVMTGGTLVQCAKVSKTLVTCVGQEYGYLCYQCLNQG